MRTLLIVLVFFVSLPAYAVVGPGEVMDDPALQQRAMGLYAELRCVKCRSENIRSSNADWARDARTVVRERLLAGDSDGEVLDFFQARYGDYVLMDPPLTLNNALLWLAGPILLLVGGAIAFAFLRGRAAAIPSGDELSDAERKHLEKLIKD